MFITIVRMIAGSLFEWLIFPVLMGNMFLAITGRKKDAGYMFYGYGIVFALFYIISLPMIYFQRTLLELSYVWLAIQGILSVMSLFFAKTLWEEMKKFFKEFNFQRHRVEMIWFLFMGGSLLFVAPDNSETMLATTVKTWYTNSMYVFEPFSGAVYAEIPWNYAISPLPVWYAMIARICNIHPTIVVKYVAAFFLMMLFMMTYRFAGGRLFTKKGKQDLFMLIIILLYAGLLFLPARGDVNILQNAWSGRCLLVNYVLVVVVALGLELSADLKQTAADSIHWKYYIGFAVILVFMSELFSIHGIFYTVVSSGVLLLVVWIERRKHAGNSKHGGNTDAN